MPDKPDRPADSYPTTLWPLLSVVCVVAVGTGLMFVGLWRVGVYVVGAACLAGSVMRLLLPRNIAGLLVVRRRIFDVFVLASAGLALIAVGISVPQ